MSLLFDESLRKLNVMFKISGIYLDRKIQNTFEHILKYRSFYIINFLWLNTDVIGELLWLIQGAIEGKNLEELTYIAPCSTYCMLANIKALTLISNEDNIQNLFTKLRDMENVGVGEYSRDKEMVVVKMRKYLNVVIQAVKVFSMLTAVLFSLSPAMLMGLEYSQSGQFKLMLQFMVVYPVDPYDIKYWPFVYLHLVWSTILVVSQVAAVDCLFYICCTSICTQLRLLQYDIETIIPGNTFEVNHFQEKFKKLILRHQEIMQAVIRLEDIYTKSTLIHFVSSSFLICLTGFNVTTTDDIPCLLMFLSFLLMSLLQVYFLCFFGDWIMTSSMEVGSAVYNSKWYTVDAKTARHLYVVQIRAWKPCKLTAHSYVDVNLKAFTKILSTSWSYFALLKTMESP
uniref:Odorant receptor n=1 Tax=Grapholita molesta TaxID=192188 RepID=A0A9Y1N8K3_GRAMO|nr:odorant-receptor-30 [Grapholita molesta]